MYIATLRDLAEVINGFHIILNVQVFTQLFPGICLAKDVIYSEIIIHSRQFHIAFNDFAAKCPFSWELRIVTVILIYYTHIHQ